MALYYFDASAVVKYYILEPASSPDQASRANLSLISEASITECAAAFAVLYRTQRISRRTRDGAFRAFMQHIVAGRLNTIPIVTADFQMAADLTQTHPLKAYDAVQLAVALRRTRSLVAHDLALTFVSGDASLIAAAQAEGLLTDNPFDHILPEDSSARVE
jgi:predicted nucleic acid-binding protein